MKRAAILLAGTLYLSVAGAQTAKSREHYADEVVFYSAKIKEEPGSITSYFARASFYQILSNFAGARSDYKKVIELYPVNQKKYAAIATDACYFLADDFYFRNSDRVNAQTYVDKGLSISPDDKRFEVLQTGIWGTYPEKAAEVQKKFESLYAKHPDDEKIALYYAKFLEKRDQKKSVQLYEKAATINPDNMDALFALGAYYTNEASRIYRESGDAKTALGFTEKGIAYFEKVHALNPDDKDIMEILIQSYRNVNRNADAERMEQKLQ